MQKQCKNSVKLMDYVAYVFSGVGTTRSERLIPDWMFNAEFIIVETKVHHFEYGIHHV